MEQQTQNIGAGTTTNGGGNNDIWLAVVNLVNTVVSSLVSLEITKENTDAARDAAELNYKTQLEGKVIQYTSNLSGLITLGILALTVAVLIFAFASAKK